MMAHVGLSSLLCMVWFLRSVSGCSEGQKRFLPEDLCPGDQCFSAAAVDVLGVSSRMECVAACQLHHTCVSATYNTASGVNECRLYDIVANSTCVNSVAGCIYMKLRDVVEPTLCPSGQVLGDDGQCACSPPWMAGDNCDMYYEDCSAAFVAGLTVPGHVEVIQIKPLNVIAPFFVKCYLGDGGYTYIEERNPSCDTDFMNRQYDDYDNGFGDVGGCSSFLGLNKIEKILKSESYNLDVEIVGDGFSGHAYYSKFFLKGSSDKYEVSWDVFSSDDLEDGFVYGDNRNLLGARFGAAGNPDPAGCAESQGTGWWYGNDCNYVNLHLPLNTTAAELSTAGSASWPVGGVLKNIYSVKMKVVKGT